MHAPAMVQTPEKKKEHGEQVKGDAPHFELSAGLMVYLTLILFCCSLLPLFCIPLVISSY